MGLPCKQGSGWRVWNVRCRHGRGGIEIPTVTFQHSLLEEVQKSNGYTHDAASWGERLSQIGVVVERCDSEEVEIEIFPDRPDLLSHETMARAARSFLGGITSPSSLQVKKGKESMVVDPTMEGVRPQVFAAIVRGVDQGSSEAQRDQFVQSLMDH